MLLGDIYLKSCEKFGKKRFAAAEFARLHKLSLQSSKVLIHRLTKTCQFLRAGRGEYVAISPVSLMKLMELEVKNKKLHLLVLELLHMFPEFKALMLYGSRIRGEADRFSDYDVLLILEEKIVDTTTVRKTIEERLGIKLHLTIYSENGYKNAVFSEPCIRFWLAEGFGFDEANIFRSPLPPVPKMAYEEWLSMAKVYMENAGEAQQTGKKCKYYFTALEVLGFIGAALKMVYDFGYVKQQLAVLIGNETILKIRSKAKMSIKDAKILERACKKELAAVDASLAGIGDNEADIYWKAQLLK